MVYRKLCNTTVFCLTCEEGLLLAVIILLAVFIPAIGGNNGVA